MSLHEGVRHDLMLAMVTVKQTVCSGTQPHDNGGLTPYNALDQPTNRLDKALEIEN